MHWWYYKKPPYSYNYDAETELRQTWQKKEQTVYKNRDTITAYSKTFPSIVLMVNVVAVRNETSRQINYTTASCNISATNCECAINPANSIQQRPLQITAARLV